MLVGEDAVGVPVGAEVDEGVGELVGGKVVVHLLQVLEGF